MLRDMKRVKQLFNVIFLDGEHLKYNKKISTETVEKSINNVLRYVVYVYKGAIQYYSNRFYLH